MLDLGDPPFRVPLHAECEGPGVVHAHSLDRAVRCTRLDG
jgi:hypothetical protein